MESPPNEGYFALWDGSPEIWADKVGRILSVLYQGHKGATFVETKFATYNELEPQFVGFGMGSNDS